MKKYQKAKILLERKAQNINKKPIYATRKLSIGLVSCMLGLVMAMPVAHAEDLDISQIDSNLSAMEDEASEEVLDSGETSDNPLPLVDDEIKKPDPAVDEDSKKTNLDGLETNDTGDLELGPELVGDPVTAAVKAPTINPVFYDATTISGANLAKAKVNKKNVIATVYVTLKSEDGTVKATLSVTPTSGTAWKVDLPKGVKVEKGDTVT
ncbi:YSIRK-type signal peptide-containing protein, partial [uncultured Anaerococcus sp.]|uniref:YSIRK-type signal peptide-containing protein n=1 Tax=uncultured Anaerococcus sp. TaxID=293428 RepID=UPI0028894C44